MMRTFEFLGKYSDLGLLVFRLIVGPMFIYHGFPKIAGGSAGWAKLGASAMGTFGITFLPAFWGFMAAFGEFGGGIMITLGLFYRAGAFLLFSTMFTASTTQLIKGAGLAKAAHSLEAAGQFFAAIFVGPGKYSLDHYLLNQKTKSETA